MARKPADTDTDTNTGTGTGTDPGPAAPPSRIEPVLDEAGAPQPSSSPPFGGSWRRDVDGGFTPLDERTARDAGLAWPG